MSPLEILVEARRLVESEENWLQGIAFKDGAYCAHGAIAYAVGGSFGNRTRAYEALYRAMKQDVATFNDSHTHAEVLKAFDRAIKAQGG